MQFKNPEILYALFLLLIPIVIHLFRLRRFQKVAFTNVALLKKVVIQTRKSSQIKKWITLFLRLFALATLILAFAGPFFPKDHLAANEVDMVIYIDNSFSMQAPGAKGTLLEGALQELYKESKENTTFHWFSNDIEKRNVSSADFKNEILKLGHSAKTLTPQEVILTAEKILSSSTGKTKQLIYLSDFANLDEFPSLPEQLRVDVVQLKPIKVANIAIDTAFITSISTEKMKLEVVISKQGESASEVPVSVYDGHQLLGKSMASIGPEGKASLEFEIDANKEIDGRIEITDPDLTFDNELFFTIGKPSKIKVLTINESDSGFLRRLFDDERFEYQEASAKALEFSLIPTQNLIILNELEEIPGALSAALNSFTDGGGSLLVIPNKESSVQSYNSFFTHQKLGSFGSRRDQEKKITQIVFGHPLYAEVFEKEVQNFQYPSVQRYFDFQSGGTPVLLYEDNKPFLIQKEKTFIFTAALNRENSNFANSPLIVPTIYNMALHSLPLPKLYYIIGAANQIAIPEVPGINEILELRKGEDAFYPLQQTKATHVLLTTDELPATAGSYEVVLNKEVMQQLSFNYNRDEGMLHYADATNWDGVQFHKDIPKLFSDVYESDSDGGLWKWFVIFALVFLLCEMLVLKFLK